MIRLSPLVWLYSSEEKAPSLKPFEIAIAQVPSRAFGDGSHPTTRLCAGAVDLVCRQKQPRALLDVGTGTGVLARIARARGVKTIFATDIDPEALRASSENFALDVEGVSRVPITLSERMPAELGEKFDWIVANILEEPLKILAPSLACALAPQGHVMISGFTRLQIPSLKTAFEAHGLTYQSEAHLDDWALLIFSA